MDFTTMRNLSNGGLASPQHARSLGTGDADSGVTIANQQPSSHLIGNILVCGTIFAFLCFLSCLAG